ncbi:MAG: acetyl-CoA hydrolase/transferase C-terminal domain-containing protein [Cycloclasticus sp.]
MRLQALLKEKSNTADAVAGWVSSGDKIDYGMSIQQPDVFDAALAAQKDRLSDVTIRGTLSTRARQVIECDPEQQHFTFENWHFSGYDRKKFSQGLESYVPFNFGEGPHIYRQYRDVDMIVIKTTPMDEHGYFNYGATNTYVRATCDVAKRIVVETCTEMPHCYGTEGSIHISEVDAVIEGDNAPLFELPNAEITDLDRTVASYIVPLVQDGSCLQIGIGGMPNAVCSALAESDIKDLGIHTEMFVDGMVDLVEAGKITGWEKQTHRGKITYTFALGTKRTYDFIHKNDMCLSLPVDETNLTHVISANDNVVSINNCLQIDLSGQVASESSGYRHISGTGGQLQFVRGAVQSKGGLSFMCLSSRYKDADSNLAPRIVPGVAPGTIVTTPRSDVMYVVTEYGIVNLKGKSVSERALALISIAHPDDRETLHQQACENNILSKKHWS